MFGINKRTRKHHPSIPPAEPVAPAPPPEQYTALQSQINPHFLYNTLECIRSEALTAGNLSIADMTEKLSRFFRYCISSQGDFVTLKDELYHLRDYFEIQQYRFGDRFQLNLLIEEESMLSCYLPKMTLQPIVENAIFHGLEPRKGQGIVTLRARITPHKLVLIISDNGIGMPDDVRNELNDRLAQNRRPTPSKESQGHGIALYNVNHRIQFYYGPPYGLHLLSLKGQGTDVEILLPVITTRDAAEHYENREE